jgi:hypothetical protein
MPYLWTLAIQLVLDVNMSVLFHNVASLPMTFLLGDSFKRILNFCKGLTAAILRKEHLKYKVKPLSPHHKY